MLVMSGSVSDLPILTLQDPADAQGTLIYDCRPPLLPVSLQLCDLGPLSGRRPAVSTSMAVPPWEEGQLMDDMGSDVVVCPELGVVPLIDSGTDLEDELPTPDDSPVSVAVRPVEATLPEVCPAPKGGIDLELAKALLDVPVLPMMVTPIVDPVVDSVVYPAEYPEPPLPVLLEDEQAPVLESSPFQEVTGNPVWECSPSFRASPVGSGDGTISSPTSPSLRIADVHGLPPRMCIRRLRSRVPLRGLSVQDDFL